MQDQISVASVKVKNKAPAQIQITAEQLLREANERKDVLFKPLKKIGEGEEGEENRLFKRKQFEDLVKRFPKQAANWLKYSQWEESINEIERARSILERGLDVDPRNISLWLRYTEFEMRSKNINCARNVFLRAINVLPRVDQFWYKFAYMEEMLGNVEGARQIYENWMKWEPAEEIWYSFIKFERRHQNWQKIRDIFNRLVSVHCSASNWIKYAAFEEERHQYEKGRMVYETAIKNLENDELEPKLFSSYAKFLTKSKAIEEARNIYQEGLKRLPKEKSEILYNSYTMFEKQYGEVNDIECIVIDKRRKYYEEKIASNTKNYDVWFDYARLEEENENIEAARNIYKRAVNEIPLAKEKKYWKRYIYLWIYWAVLEEYIVKDYELTEQVYKNCLSTIPHKEFTFAKVWSLYAKFMIRQGNLQGARRIMGQGIGLCGKGKIFTSYIELEIELKEFDRARKIYEKFLEWNPTLSLTWIKYAELEGILGDDERSRGIYEIALQQPEIDNPEFLWKSFIDFEYEAGEYSRVRTLYTRLLEISEHVKIWISLANFEASLENAEKCRDTFEKGYQSLKKQSLNEERVLLLAAWKEFELSQQQQNVEDKESQTRIQNVEKMFPQRNRNIRSAEYGEDGTLLRQEEEYTEYIWPDQQDTKAKLLDIAHKWKAKQI